MVDLLPDSRPRRPLGAKWTRTMGWMIPVYCFNCGTPWGMVPEKMCTFACVLCDPCVDKHGKPAHMRAVPDHEFWGKVEEEYQAAAKASPALSREDLLRKSLEDPYSQLAKLAREWEAQIRKVA